MSLFDRLFPEKDPRPKVHEDKTFGLPAGRAAQDHAVRSDWRMLREVMAKERDPARR
jgi:tetrahydromethanopterin S-methyltransferase subunit H